MGPGDTVMAHAALSRIGRMLNGPDILIGALLDATGTGGTVLAYTDWDARYDELLDADGRLAQDWRAHVPPFDAAASRAARGNGALPEFCALGRCLAATRERPSRRLVLGRSGSRPAIRSTTATATTRRWRSSCPLRARIPDKRVIRYEVPFAAAGGSVDWRITEEFDTAHPIVAGLDDDDFAAIVTAFPATDQGTRGVVGDAPSVLVEAAPMVAFAVGRLEQPAIWRREPDRRTALH